MGAELAAQPVVAGLGQHLALALGGELAGDVGVDQHGVLLTAGAWPCALALTARFGLPGSLGAEAGLPLPRRAADRGTTAHSRTWPTVPTPG